MNGSRIVDEEHIRKVWKSDNQLIGQPNVIISSESVGYHLLKYGNLNSENFNTRRNTENLQAGKRTGRKPDDVLALRAHRAELASHMWASPRAPNGV